MPLDSDVFAVLLSLVMAIGLAASCGFRVFAPLLVVGLAARAELIELSEGFAWMASTPALVCVAVATALEVGAYYVPWLDNALDTVATPAAVIAGGFVAAAVMVEVDPWLRWTTAAIAGGGAAAVVQLPTVALRAMSSASTAGAANPLVSSAETGAAVAVSATAALAPLALPVLLLGVVAPAGWMLFARARRASAVA